MPLGIVRQDLNVDHVSFRKGNPVPATNAAYNTNPVTWSPSAAHFGNAVTAPVAYGNAVTWAPAATHFGNVIS